MPRRSSQVPDPVFLQLLELDAVQLQVSALRGLSWPEMRSRSLVHWMRLPMLRLHAHTSLSSVLLQLPEMPTLSAGGMPTVRS